MPFAFVRKELDVGQNLMRGEDNFRSIGSLPNVIGQGLRNLAISYGASMKDPNLRWIWPRLEFFPDCPVNQFPGRLEDENSVVISDEFTGSVDYLMGFAGAARSGTVFDTHWEPIDDLSGIYPVLSDNLTMCSPEAGCQSKPFDFS